MIVRVPVTIFVHLSFGIIPRGMEMYVIRFILWIIQQTQNIFITFAQRRPNVYDVDPTKNS